MRVSNKLRADPARMRVLGQGSPESSVLHQQTCLRCGNIWWPQQARTLPSMQEPLLGSSPSNEKDAHSRHRFSESKRAPKLVGRRNGQSVWDSPTRGRRHSGPLIRERACCPQRYESRRAYVAGDGRTHGTGIRKQVGERATESASPITKSFPAPHTRLRGRDQSELRGGAHRSGRAWKVTGRLARCSVAPRCHHRDAGVPTRA